MYVPTVFIETVNNVYLSLSRYFIQKIEITSKRLEIGTHNINMFINFETL
jgi:hypothetical protein